MTRGRKDQNGQNFTSANDSLKKAKTRKQSSSRDERRSSSANNGLTKTGRTFRISAMDHGQELQPILKQPPVSTTQHRNNPIEPGGRHTSTPMPNHQRHGNGQNVQQGGQNNQNGQNFHNSGQNNQNGQNRNTVYQGQQNGQNTNNNGQNHTNNGQNHNRPTGDAGNSQNQRRTVTIGGYDGDREDEGDGQNNRPNPNQNPPFPMGYSDNQLGPNDSGNDRYSSDNSDRGQNRNNNNNNRQNNGQNNDRNENQFRNRPPNQLCRRFGTKNECSFDTFEFDFQLACKMHKIPAAEKVDWLLMHIEGPIKEHAMSWLKDRGMDNQPTYNEIIGELRPSFQQKMSVEIAERKLVGREWNIFTPIDAFLHETRELVQCALLGLT
ncbi:MAG: hypothetical protein GY820_37895, partial [Gammaproteobacteria bacterium]|nr:hypothetical protein [Gammaproteobacteria bacterium]